MNTDAMRAALDDAARSLETIATRGGKDEFLSDLRDVAAYAGNRARVARAALAQPGVMAEPVAWQWLDTGNFRKSLPANAEVGAWRPLYTAPPASAERVPLTDEQIASATSHVLGHAPGYYVTIARAIERAHGITAKVAP